MRLGSELKKGFNLNRLFWKILFSFLLINISVLVLTTYFNFNRFETQSANDNHQLFIQHVVPQAIDQFESQGFISLVPQIRRGPAGLPPPRRGLGPRGEPRGHLEGGRGGARQARHERPERGPGPERHLRPIISIWDDAGKLIHGSDKKPKYAGAQLRSDYISDSGRRYQITSYAPSPLIVLVKLWDELRSPKFIVMLIISTLVIFLLARMITRPLEQLGGFAKALAKGQFDEALEIKLLKRKDELGGLAQELHRMSNALNEIIESKQYLLNHVSHELRAPLARLQVAVGIAEQQSEQGTTNLDDGKVQANFARIQLECEKMDALIESILNFSKLSGQAPLLEDIDVALFFDRLIEDLAFEFPEQHFKLNKKAIKETDKETKLLHIKSQPDLWLNIFGNILRNAAIHGKSLEEGGDSVLTEVRKKERMLEVRITDSGGGVPSASLQKLTEPFFRTEQYSQQGPLDKVEEGTKASGFGLGLSIAKLSIEKLGGNIRFENIDVETEGLSPKEAAKGLCVTIKLPL